ncbi:acyl-CoA synthetase [Bosea caraganae]|uniref:Acyl-CoA synthetase n=1 Tax=Bosea caraganae TaxID=2763117 RepID=A0A370L845_9HYPH|nr:acyl-CoA synthetase [Bosea caraganae]RDJ25219.1 acyl-CoA synthetase [Bosea caraganae]RDJ26329.1 acyl-CoA synthetase [Bosea caraganae]
MVRPTADGVQIDLSAPPDLAYLAGHFPEAPIVPGVVQINWAIELAARHLQLVLEAGTQFQVKYRRVFLPGRPVTLTLTNKNGALRFDYADQGDVLSSGSIRLKHGESR